MAAAANKVDTCILLIKKYRVNVNAANIYGVTSIMEAARAGNDDLLRTLVSMGGSASQANEKHATALHLCCISGKLSTARMLMKEFSLDPNQANDAGNTAVHMAAIGGFADLIHLLCDHFGGDPSIKNSSGVTPAVIAHLAGHEHASHVIGQLGGGHAKGTTRDEKHDTPTSVAEEKE